MMNHRLAQSVVDNDITTLYTRFGQAGAADNYQEIVRDQAALNAALRWPLLAEMQGVATPFNSPEDTASADRQP